jgi:predicted nucleic acid-binding Zn ribbon protein
MAKPIKDVLAQLIIRRGYGRQLEQEEMEEAWLAIVGPTLADNAKPRQPYRGTVEVIAKNSTVLQELTFQKIHLLKKFQEQLPGKTIRDLRFRVGSF